jgi:hypothetical protein
VLNGSSGTPRAHEADGPEHGEQRGEEGEEETLERPERVVVHQPDHEERELK